MHIVNPNHYDDSIITDHAPQFIEARQLVNKIMESVRAERRREEIIGERERPISRTAYILRLRRNKIFRKIKAGKSLIHADNRLAMSTPCKTASDMPVTAGKV
jgi:hypothetical protein